MTLADLEIQVQRALSVDLPYSERLLRPAGAHAAVLALLGEGAEGISLLITRRPESIQSHQGQMAFPGGRCEPGELARQDWLATALRETEEEVGIPPALVRIVGALPELITITEYRVTPYVGVLTRPIDEVPLRTNSEEVAEAFWIPWALLTAPETYRREMLLRGQVRFPTHVYSVRGCRIWGATGAMIKNLLDRLERIG